MQSETRKLRPIQIINNNAQGELPPDPTRICEICGKEVPGSEAINYIASIGVAGDPRLKPIQCPYEEHWSCSIEHLQQVAHACITEHLKEILVYAHNQIGGSIHAS